MNVSLNSKDAVSGILKVEVEKDDYKDRLDKSLHKLRRNANMPGFRKGMVPMSLIKKMYGKQMLAEEVNNLVSEKVFEYIRDNKVDVLGQPIPNQSEQKHIDFDTDENFEFCFDLALAPEFDIKLSKKDKLIFYKIKVDEELVDRQIDSYRKTYGSYDSVEVVEEEDLVKGIVAELEDGEPKAGGILIEEGMLMPKYMKGKMEQKKFLGAKLGKKIVFNPNKAYKGAEAEISSFLKIDKGQVKDMKSDFTFEIKEITRHKPAEIDQVLFDKVFGKDAVKDEAEFREKVKGIIEVHMVPQSEYKFIDDIRTMFLKKAGDLAFADDILKRWLLLSNEKNTEELVEQDFPKVIEDLKYHLAKDKVLKDNDIKAEKEDMEAMAKHIAREQFAQYGIMSPPENVIENYAKELMAKKDAANDVIDRVLNEKLSEFLKGKISVETKDVTTEEFNKLFEVKNETKKKQKETKKEEE